MKQKETDAAMRIVLGIWIAKGYVDFFDRFEFLKFLDIEDSRTDSIIHYPPLACWMLANMMYSIESQSSNHHIPALWESRVSLLARCYTVSEQEIIYNKVKKQKISHLRG